MQAEQCWGQHISLAHLEQEVLSSARLMRLDVAQCELAARLRLHVKGPDTLRGPRLTGTLQQITAHPSCLEQDSKECASALCCRQLKGGQQTGQTSTSELRIAADACSALGQCALWCQHAAMSGRISPLQQCMESRPPAEAITEPKTAARFQHMGPLAPMQATRSGP